jgi:16S rRNA (guanine527-N7)-methyltransferase
VAELCRRFGLDGTQEAGLGALLAALADRHAPTTVREPRAAARVHLADSLIALELEPLRTAATLADLGAGAGFPGLPLAVALPRTEVRLVESQRRKCEFVATAARAAGAANARVVCARVEEWEEGLGGNDVAVARALARAPVVLEYAAPLLRVGGLLVDWRGRRDGEDEAAATAAAAELGLRLVEVRHVEPYAGARDHHLHVWEKHAATPARFPRRAGVARKRPLGC